MQRHRLALIEFAVVREIGNAHIKFSFSIASSVEKSSSAHSPRVVFNPRFSSSPKQDYNDPCPYSLSPVTIKSQKLLRSPRKATRKISRIPFKVLDAPELQDDFYLNLVDWSAQNVLAVGLGSCVYLWSACTSQVSRDPTNFLITCSCESMNVRCNIVGRSHKMFS